MGAEWSRLALGEILSRVQSPIQVEDNHAYQQVTVAIKGRGLRSRGTVPGSDIKTKRQFRIRANQLLVSRIDARNGGIGVIPQDLDGAVVSGDFPVFRVDKEICHPQYLDLYVRRPIFWEECLFVSEGSTNRVRLAVDDFLSLTIEIPPLAEQCRIVTMVDTIARAERSREAEAAAARRMHEAGRVTWIEMAAEETVPLGELTIGIEGGKSPQCLNRPPESGEYGVLKVSAIRDGAFRPEEAKALPGDLTPWPQTIRAGDLLYSRANTANLVGAVCLCESDYPRLLLCDKTMRLVVDHGQVSGEFLIEAIGVPSAREHIENMAGGTSDSMRNISQAAFLATEIPLLSPTRQLEAADRLRTLRSVAQGSAGIAERLGRSRVALVEHLMSPAETP